MRHLFPRPTLILLMGVAGSGKTTLARRLLPHLQVVYLDNNFIADAYFPETRVTPEYLQLRPRLYTALYRIVEENLAVGNSVLLDAPHVWQMQNAEWRAELDELLARTGSDLVVIRCHASEPELRRRLRERGLRRDRWKLENWERYLEEQPIDVPIPYTHLEVDAELPPEEQVRRVLAFVSSS